MHLFLFVSVMVLSASAVPQLPVYSHLEAEYGEIPFEIATATYYPSEWQRINGDPHGQTAEAEAPDALGDETLSFDFPTGDDMWDLILWRHLGTDFKMLGEVTNTKLSTLEIHHPLFQIYFNETFLIVDNATFTLTFSYADVFSIDLGIAVRISSTDVAYNIKFEYIGYVFIIIGKDGIYEPDYDVTGNIQHALSVTKVQADNGYMGALMGQIDGYWIYAPLDPEVGDLALAQAKINGNLGPLFQVRKSRHLGKYKTCWHYGGKSNTNHAILGNISDFIVQP